MTSADAPLPRRALVLGHFSTVGDIEVLDWVRARLGALGVPFDVSAYSWKLRMLAPGFVDARRVDPQAYDLLVVVCGPFDPGTHAREIDVLSRLRHCRWVGVNLTMTRPLAEFDPFDALLERDSDRMVRPDLSLEVPQPRVPVLGLCLAGAQKEYGGRQRHGEARERLLAAARGAGAAVLELDTSWPGAMNKGRLGSPAEFESVLARVDVLLTTRLHGMVLALKNGVPVVALDAIAGGGKVLEQARALGWPEAFGIEGADDLGAALARCLEPGARERALACAARGREGLGGMEEAFAAAIRGGPGARDLPEAAAMRRRTAWRQAYEGFKRWRARGS